MRVDVTAAAARLVCGVAERDPAETHDVLLNLDRDGLMRLAVLLAASVDPEQPLVVASAPTDAHLGTVARIVTAVSMATGISATDIYGRTRISDVAEARMVTCWIASALGLKSTQIGRALHRDHSTVLSAVDRVTGTPRLLTIARRTLDQIHENRHEEAA